jgi:hypothetical protein
LKQYLYHRVPPKLLGNIIYPLNQLKDLYPRAYNYKVQKYVGREYLLSKSVPILDCLWNDVVFLLAVHPRELLEHIELAKLPSPKAAGWGKFFKIPVESLDLFKLATWIEYKGCVEDFAAFDVEKMGEYATIPDLQIEYWKEMSVRGQYLVCPHTTHILYKGIIDVSSTEIITL